MVKSREALLDCPEHSGGAGHRCPRAGDGDPRRGDSICGITSQNFGVFFLRGSPERGNESEGQCRGWGVNPAVSMAPGAWGRNEPRKLWRNNCAAGPARLEKAGGKGGAGGWGKPAGRGWGGHVRPRGRGPKATPERNRVPPRGSVPGANFSPRPRDRIGLNPWGGLQAAGARTGLRCLRPALGDSGRWQETPRKSGSRSLGVSEGSPVRGFYAASGLRLFWGWAWASALPALREQPRPLSLETAGVLSTCLGLQERLWSW